MDTISLLAQIEQLKTENTELKEQMVQLKLSVGLAEHRAFDELWSEINALMRAYNKAKRLLRNFEKQNTGNL